MHPRKRMEQFNKQTTNKIEQKKFTSSTGDQNQKITLVNTLINNNVLFDKIKLSDIVIALKVKTLKTAKRWCKQKGLVLMKFGKEQYVNLIDFQLQIDRPFLDDLRLKFPNDWAEIYQYYKTFNWSSIAEQVLNHRVKSNFTVQGSAANNFLNKMKRHE